VSLGAPETDTGTQPRTVYGDAAYGSGQFLDRLAEAGVDSRRKTQRPTAAGGMFTFTKDQFTVNLDDDTVTCPAGNTASIRRGRGGDGTGRPPSPLPAPTAPLRAHCNGAHIRRAEPIWRCVHCRKCARYAERS
jgi:hypothetical protein